MEQLLLMSDGAIIGIAAGAGGVIVLLTLLYGALRRATRITWIGFQIPLAFGLLLLAGLIPSTGNELADFGISSGAMLLCAILPLLLEWIVRNIMYSPRRAPAGKGARVCNRIFGAVGALLGFLSFFVVVGGFALKATEVMGVEALSPIYENQIWQFFGGHAADLLFVSFFLIVIRAGYRLGLLRAIFYILMFALTAGALLAAGLFTFEVGFMRSFAGIIANAFKGMHHAVASVLGYTIAILISFVVAFAVVTLIGVFLNWAIKKINTVRAIAFIDGLIVCLIYTAVFFALAIAVYYGAYALAEGPVADLLPEGFEWAADIGKSLSRLFSSSPIAGRIFETNPLRMIG